MNKFLDFYKKLLGYENMPEFLKKYLEVPCLLRLKDIGYFCGMDYASKNIYDFKEKVTRYDHSITTSLITWYLMHDKEMTLAALFHDIATPCFSHVIDYMHKDYNEQERTEEFTNFLMKRDQKLMEYLEEDNISIEKIANFKNYSIVDNNRPLMCADRLDGIILTGFCWTKDFLVDEIYEIINSIAPIRNENDELEISFTNENIANRVYEVNDNINVYCHSSEDNYMMELLADITKEAINKGIIIYEELYILKEEEVLSKIKNSNEKELIEKLEKFETIKISEIPETILPQVKERKINPLVLRKRLKNYDTI